jgi:putative transposase
VRNNAKLSAMPSSHVSLHYHLVFSTKNREAWITPTYRERIHDYLGGTVRGLGGVPHVVGGVADHVHVFAGLRATHCLADVLRQLKSESSAWIHNELRLGAFAWQEGYGAFTVSASHLESVRNNVLRQEEHHRIKSFQEEYVEMLKRGMVEYNEASLW